MVKQRSSERLVKHELCGVLTVEDMTVLAELLSECRSFSIIGWLLPKFHPKTKDCLPGILVG
ncbi:9007_t:CDS:2 [Funneliformis geosporum]|uniref:9007_t:CDS:1 n=1 Tax=Funneliformis geosporum TaxID=1117311 RepID=A0A9W4SXV5_9GLOM|nr:9007_t:CDS:2 [Funneliformis geosporum]